MTCSPLIMHIPETNNTIYIITYGSTHTLIPYICTARKGQGNVFLSVVLFTGEGGGLCPWVSLPGGLGLCLGVGSLPGGLGLCRGGWVSIGGLGLWGVSVRGDFCPGGLCPGDLCPGGLCPGGLYLGVSVQWGSLSRRPPYGKERAVRILLECILVMFYFRMFTHVCCEDLSTKQVQGPHWHEGLH